ncbi:MAG: hypothetical protein AAFP86_02220, partial [Planctomycetota bacterium]
MTMLVDFPYVTREFFYGVGGKRLTKFCQDIETKFKVVRPNGKGIFNEEILEGVEFKEGFPTRASVETALTKAVIDFNKHHKGKPFKPWPKTPKANELFDEPQYLLTPELVR